MNAECTVTYQYINQYTLLSLHTMQTMLNYIVSKVSRSTRKAKTLQASLTITYLTLTNR